VSDSREEPLLSAGASARLRERRAWLGGFGGAAKYDAAHDRKAATTLNAQPGTSADRILTADILTLELETDGPAPEDVVSGSPRTSSRVLGQVGETEVGVWQLTEGAVTDTEADEIFIVLAGEGTVAFPDGSEVELRPGVAVRLHAGDRTVWTIRETLRKIYIV
jgi:uncharacterized cupin superfamily protein